MFGSRTRRENKQLRDRNDVLERQLRAARLDCGEERREKSEWHRRAERIGDDRIASEKRLSAAQRTIATRDNELDTWSSIAIVQAERHGRLIRAVVRYRAELGVLLAEVAKLRSQAGVPDRAVDPAQPTPELLRVTRERNELRGQLAAMQDRLDAYQRASEAADWKLAKRAGTRVDAPKALAS